MLLARCFLAKTPRVSGSRRRGGRTAPNGYHCGAVGNVIYMPKTKFWHCRACRKQFSVTAGTPMHRTHLPLLTWAQAVYLIVSSSKGISAVKRSELLRGALVATVRVIKRRGGSVSKGWATTYDFTLC